MEIWNLLDSVVEEAISYVQTIDMISVGMRERGVPVKSCLVGRRTPVALEAGISSLISADFNLLRHAEAKGIATIRI
jgi:hypothetical protein